ncbi:FtsQ-type POTRA domain-containing protein [Curtobacterium flaccumfaciens]|nr:FtsQ-type POTRA domain-containing protein [Curtobacterium flaccumfaciens]
MFGVSILVAVFSPLMALQTIEVKGTNRVDETQLRQALSDQIGTPLARLDFDAIKRDIAGFPLIEKLRDGGSAAAHPGGDGHRADPGGRRPVREVVRPGRPGRHRGAVLAEAAVQHARRRHRQCEASDRRCSAR